MNLSEEAEVVSIKILVKIFCALMQITSEHFENADQIYFCWNHIAW